MASCPWGKASLVRRKGDTVHMKTRRFLAWAVAALLLLTSFALPAPLSITREAKADTEAAAEEKYYTDSGKCGPDLTWSFDSRTGELIITGSGAMYDYFNDAPWVEKGLADQIESIDLPKNLTSIGEFAFDGCTALTSITIPGKVKTIGRCAFSNCSSLVSVTLPKSRYTPSP